jgi:hypothetical protein
MTAVTPQVVIASIVYAGQVSAFVSGTAGAPVGDPGDIMATVFLADVTVTSSAEVDVDATATVTIDAVTVTSEADVTTPTTGPDADALDYIGRVQDADGQALEPAVRDAINAFVVGCKADGIWDAIQASCILAGARTLDGALVPLKGTAPTSFNFVPGDYNRTTGLVGDGSTKRLGTNRNNNADPQNSNHNAVYITVATSLNNQALIGASDPFNEAGSNVLRITNTSSLRHQSRRGSPVTTTVSSPGPPVGFAGHSRAASGTYTVRGEGVDYSISGVSQATNNRDVAVFARTETGGNNSSCRLAFYSVGEAIDLAQLDARVTTLINAYAAVIP